MRRGIIVCFLSVFLMGAPLAASEYSDLQQQIRDLRRDLDNLKRDFQDAVYKDRELQQNVQQEKQVHRELKIDVKDTKEKVDRIIRSNPL